MMDGKIITLFGKKRRNAKVKNGAPCKILQFSPVNMTVQV